LKKLVCIVLAFALTACVPIGIRTQSLPYSAATATR
jgi:hypothetical protein